MKILVDTNVIIDALASREPWNKSAENIFLLGANNIVDLYITASSATDIYYLLRKYLHNTESAKQVMRKLYFLVGILEVSGADCLQAIDAPISDYEAAVVEQVAFRNHMEYIVTRNIKDYQKGRVKAILPDDFISNIEKEY